MDCYLGASRIESGAYSSVPRRVGGTIHFFRIHNGDKGIVGIFDYKNTEDYCTVCMCAHRVGCNSVI